MWNKIRYSYFMHLQSIFRYLNLNILSMHTKIMLQRFIHISSVLAFSQLKSATIRTAANVSINNRNFVRSIDTSQCVSKHARTSVPRCPDSDRTTAVVRSGLLLQPVPVTHYSLVMARLIDSALRKRPVLREELHSFIRTYMSVCKVFVVVVCPPVDNSNWRKFFYFRCVGSFLQLDFYLSFLELFVKFIP